MDGAGYTNNNDNSKNLETNLQTLEQASQENKSVCVKRLNGKLVVLAVPKRSIFVRFYNWLFCSRERRTLHDQLIGVLSDSTSDKTLRERVLKGVTAEKRLPLFSAKDSVYAKAMEATDFAPEKSTLAERHVNNVVAKMAEIKVGAAAEIKNEEASLSPKTERESPQEQLNIAEIVEADVPEQTVETLAAVETAGLTQTVETVDLAQAVENRAETRVAIETAQPAETVETVPEAVPETVSEAVPEAVFATVSEKISEKKSEKKSEKIPEAVSQKAPEKNLEKTSKARATIASALPEKSSSLGWIGQNLLFNWQDINPQAVQQDVQKKAQDCMQRLREKMPNVALIDARGFLECKYMLDFLDEPGADSSEIASVLQELKQHFKETRQEDEFDHLKMEMRQTVVKGYMQSHTQDEAESVFRDTGRPQRQALLEEVKKNVFKKTTMFNASIHGHPRELLARWELDFLERYLDPNKKVVDSYAAAVNFVKNNIESVTKEDGFKTLGDELGSINMDEVAQLIQNVDAWPPERLQKAQEHLEASSGADTLKAVYHRDSRFSFTAEELQHFKRLNEVFLPTLAKARKTLMTIQLNSSVGRRLNDDLLAERQFWPTDADFDCYRKLKAIDGISSPLVFDAQRRWLMQQHDSREFHPQVVVEGGGPTGLTLALTQFEAGGDVTVLEQRDTAYNRAQIVRLDPKWMCMLKFYLGDRYYQLFGDEGRGCIRPDGFGEITTKHLEDALHMELSELISLRSLDHGQSAGLERLARHRADKLQLSEDGQSYQVAAAALDEPDSTEKRVINADLLICAGGKNSPMVKAAGLSPETVTESKNYGVCTWEDHRINNGEMNTFGDFRQMMVFDERFEQELKKQWENLLSEEKQDEWLEPKEMVGNAWLSATVPMKVFNLEAVLNEIKGQTVQTRCFENRGAVYIGMEVPEAFSAMEERVAAYMKKRHAEAAENKQIKSAMHQAWFQTVANLYGLEEKTGLTADHVNQNALAMFPVSQHSLENPVVHMAEEKSNARITVTAAGDAAASPHFMRYSGLTGARENILDLQTYVQNWVSNVSDKKGNNKGRLTGNKLERRLHKNREDLELAMENTASFVIERGGVFLDKKNAGG